MANSIHLSIKGFEEFTNKLDRMKDSHAMRARMQGVLLDCAEDIRRLAALNASRMFRVKTGNLSKSLNAKPGRTTNPSAYVKAAFRIAPHAHLLEFGHRIVGHKPRKVYAGKQTEARPFFKSAVNELRAEIRRKIAAEIQRFLVG
jgi:HK97 gp10 family phage protein